MSPIETGHSGSLEHPEPDQRDEPRSSPTISDLIETRRRELDLRPSELVRRLGWVNVNSGMKALTLTKTGVINDLIIRNGAAALEVPEPVVAAAIAETHGRIAAAQRARQDAEEQAYDAQFKPFVLIKGERYPRPVWKFSASWEPAKIPAPTGEEMMPRLIAAHLRRSGGKIDVWGRVAGYVLVTAPTVGIEFTIDGERIGPVPVPRV